MIYLDYAADYPVRREVLDALVDSEILYRGNMNSTHTFGKIDLHHFKDLEKEFLDLFHLDPNEYELIFTSSATESNNLAIKGVFESYSGYGNKILTSEFEHNSVNAALSYLKSKGADAQFVETTHDGKMNLEDLKKRLDRNTILTCLALVESEVGTIQDYRKAQEIVSQNNNGFLLLDATQAIGKLSLDFNGIDLISFTPHKYGGLKGTGLLLKKKSIVFVPQMHGGKSGSLYRAGTEPVSLFESSYVATKLALEEEKEHFAKVSGLSSYLRSELKKMDKVQINSFEGNPYILNFSVDGYFGAQIVDLLDQKGFAVSQKSACSIPNTPSKAVMSIYHDKKRALSSMRVSISSLTTHEELEQFLDTLKEILYGKK